MVIKCKQTDLWIHKKCSQMTNLQYNSYKLKPEPFICNKCISTQNQQNTSRSESSLLNISATSNDSNLTAVISEQRETTTCQHDYQNINDSFVPSDDDEENWSDPPLIQDGSPHEINISSNSTFSESSSNLSIKESVDYDIFGEVKALRNINRKRPVIGYLNINSVRYKFTELRQIFDDKLVDIFTISETKIDNSFCDNIFSVEGYNMERRERNKHGEA